MVATHRIYVKVPCYVYQFLQRMYHTEDFHVIPNDYSLLRNAFIWQGNYIDALLPSEMLSTTEVLLVIHGDVKLYRGLNSTRSRIPSKNFFFHFEFYNALDHWCMGLEEHGYLNRKQAVALFLRRYGITEEMLPPEHAYRYLTSFRKKRKDYVSKVETYTAELKSRPTNSNNRQAVIKWSGENASALK